MCQIKSPLSKEAQRAAILPTHLNLFSYAKRFGKETKNEGFLKCEKHVRGALYCSGYDLSQQKTISRNGNLI